MPREIPAAGTFLFPQVAVQHALHASPLGLVVVRPREPAHHLGILPVRDDALPVVERRRLRVGNEETPSGREERKRLLEQGVRHHHLLPVESLHVLQRHDPFEGELPEGKVAAAPLVGDVFVVSFQEVEAPGKAALHLHDHAHHAEALPHLLVHALMDPVLLLELFQRRPPAPGRAALGVHAVPEAHDLEPTLGQQVDRFPARFRLVREDAEKEIHPGVDVGHDDRRQLPVQQDQPARSSLGVRRTDRLAAPCPGSPAPPGGSPGMPRAQEAPCGCRAPGASRRVPASGESLTPSPDPC